MSNIRFNTSGLGSSQNSLYEVEKFNGVDYTTTPTAVDETRAVDISNYLPEGNGLVKRNGYTSVLLYDSSFESYDEMKDVYAIAKHDGYYTFFQNQYHYSTHTPQGYTFVTADEPSFDEDKGMVFDYDNAGRGGCYSSTGNVKKATIIDLSKARHIFTGLKYYGESNAYVPLIATNIPSMDSNGKALSLEQPNLLTKKVRIELNFLQKIDTSLNKTTTAIYDISPYLNIGNKSSVYRIGEHTFASGELVDVTGTSGGMFAYEPNSKDIPITIIDSDNNKTQIKGQIKIDFAKSTYSGVDTSTGISMGNKIRVSFVNSVYGGTFEAGKDYYVQCSLELELDGTVSSNEIDKCDGAILFDDKIFAYNSKRNIMYHTLTPSFPKDNEAYNYFGSETYQLFGDSSSGIISAGVLNNGYMIVIKESSQGKTNIYLRHKEYRNTVVDYSISTTNGEIVYQYNKTEELYPITQAGIELECNENTTIAQYDNKVIISTPKGIYYINVENSTASQTYNAYELSYMIRNDLSDDLNVNSMVVYNGQLWVARKNKDGKIRIYVADKDRYTFVDGKMQYEWWVLDGIDAERLFCVDGELFFTDYFSKRLFVMNNNKFYDIINVDLNTNASIVPKYFSDTHTITQTGYVWDSDEDGFLEQENVTFTFKIIDYFAINFNEQMKQTYDKEDYLLFKKYTTFYVWDGEETSHTSSYYSWNTIKDLYYIKFDNQNNEIARYKIEDCDLIDGKWYYTADNHFDLLGNKGTVIFAYVVMEDDMVDQISSSPDGYSWDREYYGTIIYNGKEYKFYSWSYYIFNRPIRTYWKSKYTDLGATETLKTTSEVYFVPETRRGGAISIGYKTAKREKDFTRRKIILSRISETEKENLVNSQQFNFADVDFTDFHFETEEFAHSYSCKRKVKNFAFIQFKFYSNEPKDSTIVKFAVKYHKTRDSRGVR